MLKFPTEEPKWTSDMASALRQFLNTSPGQVFLQRLYWLRPTPPDLPTAHGSTLDLPLRVAHAEAMGGYERAIQDIIRLTESPE
jgi:ABC-type sulfate transport system substrate-binding protein